MRRLTFTKRNRSGNLLHIETDEAIINIRVGLINTEGKKVTSIEIIPDAGYKVDGKRNTRIIEV